MSETIVQVTGQSFPQEVLSAEVPVVVDFWAPWCGPCRMVAPEMEKLAEKMGARARVVKVNVDENAELAGRHGVMSIPTLLVMHKGREIGRHVGFIAAEPLATALEDYLGSCSTS
jgi:thioredoxin 1